MSAGSFAGVCIALALAGCAANCLRDSDCGDGYVCHRDACWLVISSNDAGAVAGGAGQAGAAQQSMGSSGSGGSGSGGVSASGGVGGSAIVTDAGAGGSATGGRENLDASSY